MKYVPIQLMDENYCLLPATEAKSILVSKGRLKVVKLTGYRHIIFVKIKDLQRVKEISPPCHLLDDNETELINVDIQKIMDEYSTENNDCE
jgi:hypothetical protein